MAVRRSGAPRYFDQIATPRAGGQPALAPMSRLFAPAPEPFAAPVPAEPPRPASARPVPTPAAVLPAAFPAAPLPITPATPRLARKPSVAPAAPPAAVAPPVASQSAAVPRATQTMVAAPPPTVVPLAASPTPEAPAEASPMAMEPMPRAAPVLPVTAEAPLQIDTQDAALAREHSASGSPPETSEPAPLLRPAADADAEVPRRQRAAPMPEASRIAPPAARLRDWFNPPDPPRSTPASEAPAPPRIHIGVVEVRAPALPAPPPRAAAPAAPAWVGLARGFGWRYGLGQS